MVTSSFSYTPGLPILHSTDLVNWQLIGHALSRASQVDMSGMQVSRGIFAPTIRYHDGTFYIITTVVDKGGNFILTATDPAGPWSDPIWLPEVEGIDPDIFLMTTAKSTSAITARRRARLCIKATELFGCGNTTR